MIKFNNVSVHYGCDEAETIALNNVSFEINEGELVTIVGDSGSGKSTCLNILGGMDRPTKGSIIVNDEDISKYKEKELIKYRKDNIGFVFQFYNLIQNLTVMENLELAASRTKKEVHLDKLLKQVNMYDKRNNFPSQLSGGEQQRVSIARALAKNPILLLCDEPTGALDYESSKQVLKLIEDTNKKLNVTTIIITHNTAITQMSDKVITFKSGKVVDIKKNKKRISVNDLEW
jgi:putative ABC transport system ATP-binding protein